MFPQMKYGLVYLQNLKKKLINIILLHYVSSQLIKESDVIISTSSSTAMVCGLLSKKPLIIHNCFQVEHDELLERGLVIECKQPSDIISSIHTAINSEPPTEKIEKFIKDTLFKSDGQSAERISDAIVNLLDNNIQQSN